ncbi:MAG: type II toxin-antitoxin system RelE/ParE family toxin [Deltaproteobacteria bacterium]|nr:type II toxin-antitoxin system RelE/ParE family toxin [Deltaproteobacteria bacterium]
MDKSITWMGDSKNKIRSFRVRARQQAGYQLRRVQQGLLPSDWKSMLGVGPGVMEIRLHEPHEHRVIYVAKFEETIYVLHAFTKKARKTDRHDLEMARKAYREVLNLRRGK